MTTRQVIHIEYDAPAKPPVGAGCNGCGVCCLAEPCPVGVLLSFSRKGPCTALVWEPGQRLYRCGAMGASDAWPGVWSTWRSRIVSRWIAAGAGCDCSLETTAHAAVADSTPTEITPSHD